jgi:hypothetical protein
MLCFGMHSNMMLRFMVQALQEPSLCSSIDITIHGEAVFWSRDLVIFLKSWIRIRD